MWKAIFDGSVQCHRVHLESICVVCVQFASSPAPIHSDIGYVTKNGEARPMIWNCVQKYSHVASSILCVHMMQGFHI